MPVSCRGYTGSLSEEDVSTGQGSVIWFDVLNPSRDEELDLERQLGVLLPTREDMAEIETSSRLYLEGGAAFMTAQLAFFGGQDHLQSGPVTFALVKTCLVTIRYIDPASFAIFATHLDRKPELGRDGVSCCLNLLDVIIDRTADLIEKTEAGIDSLSKAIFRRKREQALEDALILIGKYQNDIARIRDSLVSLARLTAFAHGLELASFGLDTDAQTAARERLKTMSQDVASLSDHTSYVTGNMSFLLDAALGLISVEQNNVMKVISVVSVIFLPLTLVASIYGMNFDYIPLLHMHNAFWWACLFMLAVAGGLWFWLKSRRWI